jgi:tripartite-type tricarboxylate transporter receptor subunit TctC
VRIVVNFPAGSTGDLTARLIGQWLSEKLGQAFVIEARAGAGGTIGTEAVVRAPADGYTLGLVGSSDAINATLYDKLNYNFIRDIAPVAGPIGGPLVMVVNPSSAAKTVPEFIAYAKDIRAGRLRALAVTSATRWEALPDVITNIASFWRMMVQAVPKADEKQNPTPNLRRLLSL